MLNMIVEGFLSESESEEAWEKKLTKAMQEQVEDTPINSMLWGLLTRQVCLMSRMCPTLIL